MNKRRQTRALLKDHNLAPKKRFGQNFLVHKQTAEAIVHSGQITKQDIVVEVGVGLGALTYPLSRASQHVFGYEIDSGIVRFHNEDGSLPHNVTLLHQDILTANFDELHDKCGNDLIIMANLPYSISNPFIFKLIDNAHLISKAIIMVQKEVADRLMAMPKSKEYGIPTILLGVCASVKKNMTLKPDEFHPRPKIDSVVITIDFTKISRINGDLPEFNRSFFNRIVRTAFSQRRKTLLNTLASGGFFRKNGADDKALNKIHTQQAIENANIAPSIRPECLDVADYIFLSTAFENLQKDLLIQKSSSNTHG
jgi:16S rRNA (adenine1518-N6/adenine1519-N6)-dimethyltransferase